MGFSLSSKGDFKKTKNFLESVTKRDIYSSVERYAQDGVSALSAATPVDSGETASSWYYEIEKTGSVWSITWMNSHSNQGVPIAIILQYGHGTGTGGYVAGRDYINPAIKPVFDKIADGVWKEVTKA